MMIIEKKGMLGEAAGKDNSNNNRKIITIRIMRKLREVEVNIIVINITVIRDILNKLIRACFPYLVLFEGP